MRRAWPAAGVACQGREGAVSCLDLRSGWCDNTTADKVMIAVLEAPGFLEHLTASVTADARRVA